MRLEQVFDLALGEHMLGHADLRMDVSAFLFAGIVLEQSLRMSIFIKKKCLEEKPASGLEDPRNLINEHMSLFIIQIMGNHHVEDERLGFILERKLSGSRAHFI